MKVYLAAQYSRHPEMRGVRDVLEAFGHKVTSRWIDLHGGRLEESITPAELAAIPGYGWEFAEGDLNDIRAAEALISFTEIDRGGKGGRHVEFGMAMALGKHLVIVGPREHIFHSCPAVEWYPNRDLFFMSWSRHALTEQ